MQAKQTEALARSRDGTNECRWPPALLSLQKPAYDFTRLSVVGFSGISLPSISALQLAVIVSASSNVNVRACMWASFFTSMPQVLSKSNRIVLLSADFITMAGRLPNMQ